MEAEFGVRIPVPQPKMDKTYCIFGDSVAQAAYVKAGWVILFSHYLEEKYRQDFVNVFNLGIGGNTSNDILKRFEPESSARNPTNIIFAVGINDTKTVAPEEFKSNLEKLARLAKEITKEVSFVGLVLGDYSSNKPFSRKKTTAFNQIIKKVAELNDCKYIPLQEQLKPEDFMDGLHPNEQGHKKIFEAIKIVFNF